MHDATEGGLRGALCETAAASGVRLDVDRERVPTDPAALAVTDHLGIDPWACTTAGSLLLSVDSAATETVVSALASRGTPAAAAGTVREGSGVYVDGERVRPPAEDPSWAAWAALGDD
jgi:hydrogenase maturation factor